MESVQYEKSRVAVDAVIFTIKNKKLMVYLEDREKEPFEGRKELPGGILLEKETAEQTLKRKLSDLIGHEDIFFQQFFTFTEPKRDPRARTISIGFIALVDFSKIKDWAGWLDCSDVSKLPDLAFDHKKIIDKGRKYLSENINTLVVSQFMPDEFPLNRLQEAYEIIEGKKYDNRNFRKKMIMSEIVVETEKIEEKVSHRPAKLYRFR